MSVTALVKQLKQAGEDHEFYPTTDAIIKRMLKDVGINFSFSSVLDIGAGNGKVLKAFRDQGDQGGATDLYAIERSLILCSQLADFAFIIGTEFWEQSLLSKQIDLTFCNPPYSEYEGWAVKIIRESASKRIYLVLPIRWQKNTVIQAALKYRDAKHKIVDTFDFENAEDRRARGQVHLIRIDLRDSHHDEDDAFDRFFDEQFAHLKQRFEIHDKQNARSPESIRNDEPDPKFTALLSAENYPTALVKLYNDEMDLIRRNYDLVSKLDVDLLRELNVKPADILKCLKERLTGLRNEYWHELFSQIKVVTNRLIGKKRNQLLDTLNRNGHVDFTLSNIDAVLIWILKHANRYLDEQLIETFENLVDKANVKNYTSNKKVFEGNRWRYQEEKPTHIALEYRLVLQHSGGIRRTEWLHDKGLEEHAAELLRDILTVAYNLGFICDTTDHRLWRRESWTSGELRIFECRVQQQPRETLFEVRAYLNGNMHIRLNQDFALALNVEMGRLKGWIVSPQDAVSELGDLNAGKFFNQQYRLLGSSLPLLMSGTKKGKSDGKS